MTGKEEPDREYFKNVCIKKVAKELGYTREQLGIIAAPWASMYFNHKWHDISFDSVKELAENGTDIVFIEKRDIVQSLGDYANDDGAALVNSHGHLPDYAEDLAELGEIKGAHIAMVTDFDIPGLKIAYDVPNALWIGVDIPMLEHFDIDIDDPYEISVVDYKPGKKRLSDSKLYEILEDPRFGADRIGDIEFLKRKKVEIDAVLAKAGAATDPYAAKKIWDYIKGFLTREFPTRNYNRAISDNRLATLPNHYPGTIKQFLAYLNKHSMSITEPEANDIKLELQNVEGFIPVKEKEQEIDKRLGRIISSNDELQEIAKTLRDSLDSSIIIDLSGRSSKGGEGVRDSKASHQR